MEKIEFDAWKGFLGEDWKTSINVSDFILSNYLEYKGDDSFLCGKSEKTKKVWAKCEKLLAKELKQGLLDVELKAVSGINTFKPGYIDQKNEVIVGLQTDKPLKRIVNLYGGIRMAEKALEAYNKKLVNFRCKVSKRAVNKNAYVIGRPIMTCCEDDVKFAGLVCSFLASDEVEPETWIDLTARITIKNHKLYNRPGPVLEAVKFTKIEALENEVATFY
jgi:hypothetical protein